MIDRQIIIAKSVDFEQKIVTHKIDGNFKFAAGQYALIPNAEFQDWQSEMYTTLHDALNMFKAIIPQTEPIKKSILRIERLLNITSPQGRET